MKSCLFICLLCLWLCDAFDFILNGNDINASIGLYRDLIHSPFDALKSKKIKRINSTDLAQLIARSQRRIIKDSSLVILVFEPSIINRFNATKEPIFVIKSDVIFKGVNWFINIPFIRVDALGSFTCIHCNFSLTNVAHNGVKHFIELKYGSLNTMFIESNFLNINSSDNYPYIKQSGGDLEFRNCNFVNINKPFIQMNVDGTERVEPKSLIIQDSNINIPKTIHPFINATSYTALPHDSDIINISNTTIKGDMILINTDDSVKLDIKMDNNVIIWTANNIETQTDTKTSFMKLRRRTTTNIVNTRFLTIFEYETTARLDADDSDYEVVLIPSARIPKNIIMNSGTLVMRDVYIGNGNNYKNISVPTPFISYSPIVFNEIRGCQKDYYSSFILNDNLLNITGMFVDEGSHLKIVYNCESGRAYISNITTAWNNNISLYNEPNSIKPMTYIKNDGILEIRNSMLFGAEFTIIEQQAGTLEIFDSVFGLSLNGIQKTDRLSSKIHLNGVQFKNMGFYYTSINAIYTLSSEFPNVYRSYPKWDVSFMYYTAPMTLYARQILIVNCEFEYATPFGMISFNDSIKSNIIIDDSVFTVDGINNMDLFRSKYQSISNEILYSINQTFTYYNITETFSSYIEDNSEYKALFGSQITVGNGDNITFTNNICRIYSDIYLFENTSFIELMDGSTLYYHSNYIENFAIKTHNYVNTFIGVYLHIIMDSNACVDFIRNKYTFQFHKNIFNNSLPNTPAISFDGIFDDENNTTNIDNSIFYSKYTNNIIYKSNGIVSLFDVELDNQSYIGTNNCSNIICHQILNNNINHIKQVILNYKSDCINDMFDQNINDYNEYKSELHTFPKYLRVYGLEEICPGCQKKIDVVILDEFNNVIPLHDVGYDVRFTVINTVTGLNQDITLYHQSRNQDITVLIPSVQSIVFGSTCQIALSIDDNILYGNTTKASVVECPSGYGINYVGNASIFQCYKCPDNTVKMGSGLYDCINCDDIEGVRCHGEDMLEVGHNYWIDYNGKTGDIITAKCPPGVCCSDVNGCNFIQNDTNTLCAKNRDVNSLLCSKCIEGYSELFASDECGICNTPQLYLLTIPYVLTLLLAFYLVFLKSYTIPEEISMNEILKQPKMYIFCDNIAPLPTMILTVLMYYNQIFSYLLLYFGVNNDIISHYLSLFNLSYVVNKGHGFCLFANMTPDQEILVNLIFPGMLLINIVVVSPIFGLIFRLCRCNICDKLTNPHIFNAFLNGLLICLGTITSVFFKLISCIIINDVRYHFYYAYAICNDLLWEISAFIILGIIIMFILLFLMIYKMDDETRNNPELNKLFKLVEPYKPSIYYYEFIYVSRRIIIGLIVFSLPQNQYTIYLLFIILIIYLIIQVKLKPFLYKRENLLESICMILLILMYAGLLSMNNKSIHYLILILLIIPWIIFIFWILKTLYNICFIDDNPQNIQKVMHRVIRTQSTKSTQIKRSNAIIIIDNDTESSITDDNETRQFLGNNLLSIDKSKNVN